MNVEKIKAIQNEVGSTKIVVASKYVTSKEISILEELGIRDFGENRIDAFLEKYTALEGHEITWHFIGHLQTTRAKKVINKIDYLHSLDSLELAKIIQNRREKPLKCFVEVHGTASETKNGVAIDDLERFLNELKKYPKVNVIGLMVMSDKEQSDDEKYEVFISTKALAEKYGLKETSMGMSDDYQIALKAGTTCVRLGRTICNALFENAY